MCGIVGYIGQQDVKDILLNGLEKLEYRGYDSAGIAVVNEAGVHIFKDKGRIAHLRTVFDETFINSRDWTYTWRRMEHLINVITSSSISQAFSIVYNGGLKTN